MSATGRPAGQPQHGRAVWAEHDGKPWQTEAFRFSNDPELEARVATWSGWTWSRRRMPSCCVWTRSRRCRRWSAPRLPPTPALPAGDIGAEQRLTGAVEGVADDRLGGGAAGVSRPQEVKQ